MGQDERFAFSLSRDNLSEQVADRIQQMIVAEALRSGDKLPAERELAERLGVCRPVIREAIRILEVRGLLCVKPGCGTYVQQVTLQSTAAHLGLYVKLQHCPSTMEELFEVRRMLEVEAAGLAAVRATGEDLQRLVTLIEAMSAECGQPEAYARHDLDFHLAVAAGAHNAYLTLLFGPFVELMAEVITLSCYASGAAEAGLRHHQAILAALTRHESALSRQAMADHMDAAQRLTRLAREQTTLSQGG